jgi:hypothetical protein
MEKYDILSSIMDVDGITERFSFTPLLSKEILLSIISKPKYSLTKELKLAATTITRYLKILIPDRPSTTNKVDVYLLHKYMYKECKHCSSVKELSEFHKNIGTRDGLNAYCKNCQIKLTSVTSAERQARYKAAKLKRTPLWVTLNEQEEIAEFYKNCPTGFHVDHILPLQGKNISGLHTLSNLQYLTAEENSSKKNTYMPL